MQKPSRLLRVFGVAGLLVSLLAVTIAPVTAQDDGDGLSQDWLDALVGGDGVGFRAGNNTIYYPWVANGDNFGLGPSRTEISIQNLEDRETVINVHVGNATGEFTQVTTAKLAPYASKTFTADELDIPAGSGAPVMVAAFNQISFLDIPDTRTGTVALVETPVLLSNPLANGESTQVVVCVVNFYLASAPNFGHPYGYVAAVDHVFAGEEEDVSLQAGKWLTHNFTQEELQETLNRANTGNPGALVNPFGGLNNDGDCFDMVDARAYILNNSAVIGGVARQIAATASSSEHEGAATPVDTAISGYNAINGIEMDWFNQWYLPIVQRNDGPGGLWDSIIRVANFDALNNAVTVRFFPANDGSGSLKEGFQLQKLVHGGKTWEIALSEHVPEGWVGSAHIYSDGKVFAMVDRHKPGAQVWITNTGSAADFEARSQVAGSNGRYALFAPHVLMDYFGWNTGINVANLHDGDNDVSIQYFNMLGNATEVLNQRLAPHGMTYFFDPDTGQQDATSDPNTGIVGSAIIWSEHPVAAVVDGVKYAGNDRSSRQATSYSATANIFPWQAVPYVSRGDASDGSGATSGINLMNPNSVSATVNVYWVNPSGFDASNFGVSSVTIPAFANGFVYTLWQRNLPNGFEGAAQVVATVPVAAVSANVTYGLAGDGSAIFNGFNPCGLYRTSDACSFGDVLQQGGQSVTTYFVDEAGDPVRGVSFSIASTSGAGYQRDGISGVDGAATFTNVPAGVYDLTITGTPTGYAQPAGVRKTFVVEEGADFVTAIRLDWAQGFTKTVCVGLPDSATGCSSVNLVGVSVIVYENIGAVPSGDPVAGDVVFQGVTGLDGTVGGNLDPGNYILCIYDEDGTVTTTNGETVTVGLLDLDELLIADCVNGTDGELFTVETGKVTKLANPVPVLNGVINIFIGQQGDTTTIGAELQNHAADLNPVKGVEVCLMDPLISNPYEAYRICAVTGNDGTVTFIVTPAATRGSGGVVEFSGKVDSQQSLRAVGIEGGELTLVATSWQTGTTLQQVSLNYFALFDFTYDPARDIAQDGYLADNPDEAGTWDIVIEVAEYN